MSRNTVVVLIYHRHKLLDLTDYSSEPKIPGNHYNVSVLGNSEYFLLMNLPRNLPRKTLSRTLNPIPFGAGSN
jgi:hypothetical protein